MGSDSKKVPRAHHKFSFTGSTKQPAVSVAPRSAKVSNDDILESMTKQVHPENAPEQFPEVGYASPLQSVDESLTPSRTRSRGSARGAFVIFLGSFLAVWLYGYVTGAYEIPYLRMVTENPEIQTGFQLASSHPFLFAAATGSLLFVALGIFYLRHRRKQ